MAVLFLCSTVPHEVFSPKPLTGRVTTGAARRCAARQQSTRVASATRPPRKWPRAERHALARSRWWGRWGGRGVAVRPHLHLGLVSAAHPRVHDLALHGAGSAQRSPWRRSRRGRWPTDAHGGGWGRSTPASAVQEEWETFRQFF